MAAQSLMHACTSSRSGGRLSHSATLVSICRTAAACLSHCMAVSQILLSLPSSVSKWLVKASRAPLSPVTSTPWHARTHTLEDAQAVPGFPQTSNLSRDQAAAKRQAPSGRPLRTVSLREHPAEVGIWTANYQALVDHDEPVDLFAPGAYVKGRRIFLPTCGHSGTLLGAHAPFPVMLSPATG
eukprot:363796-Chlamydomonas_euryale.AAC.2